MDAFAGLWPASDPSTLLARFHEIEPEVQRGSNTSYATVLHIALERVADAEDLPLDEAERDTLVRSLPEWPPFAEVPDALDDLRTDGWRLAILSNTDPELLDTSVKRLGGRFDKLITVAEAGSYKPATGHFDRFFATTPIDRSQHAHVAASLFHDIAPCADLGITSVWVNRKDETTTLQPASTIPTLEPLPDVLANLIP
jgi:2-haloalkanoic acid dehalogenase type II